MKASIVEILRYLVPNCDFSCIGEITTENQYLENVTWNDSRPQPSWAEVEATKPIVEAESASQMVADSRRSAFVTEADPLFFGWQRNENTEQDWLDKVAEIRARYPYPA